MKIIIVSAIAWAIAQGSKLFLTWHKTKKLNLYSMFASGGMPSSHTTFVVSMATQVRLIEGIDSTLYAIALCFCLIVMYDAAGVRHAIGKQARMINMLIDRHNEGEEVVNIQNIREVLGHTPTEVFVGIILGLTIGHIGYYI